MSRAWVQIACSLPTNPKILAVGPAGGWLYLQGLCYCGEHLTDGFIPTSALAVMPGATVEQAAVLVAAGLWLELENGWQVHDYLLHQQSREQVLAKREGWKKRTARARQRRAEAEAPDPSHGVTTGDLPQVSADVTRTEVQGTHATRRRTEEEEQHQHLPAPHGAAQMPRVHTAQAAVTRIQQRLSDGIASGANAWNISRLVRPEFDAMVAAEDVGGAIALTGWYVASLRGEPLSSKEFGRIGQMVRRFGRVALLAIDEAAIKDLDDLVSYAFRVAQTMDAERSPA